MRTVTRVVVLLVAIWSAGATEVQAGPISFSVERVVSANIGDTGVQSNDIVMIDAFYDPDDAHLEYQDGNTAVYSFGAAYSGLTVSIGSFLWQTVGPLTVQAIVNDGPAATDRWIQIEFLGYTKVQQTGVVTTQLSTPWTNEVTGNEWIMFFQRFALEQGSSGSSLLGNTPPADDFASSFQSIPLAIEGAMYADTSTGNRFVNFANPAFYSPAVARILSESTQVVPEPTTFHLLGLGMVALFARMRNRQPRTTSF